MQLGAKHDRCYRGKKRSNNESLFLNLDDKHKDLKMMCSIVIGKSIKDAIDTQRTTIETSRAVMKTKNELNMCRNMLRFAKRRLNLIAHKI